MKRIGRYDVKEQIGRGGMGAVYRARDPELDREVALKLLERGSAQQRARFAREAEGLARVRHPNVVRVHEVGEEGDRSYLVMELVRGEDLQRRIDRDGPMDADEVARIGLDLARALEQAHRQGILHRDLKPSNVLIVDDGRPLLTDFGLAQLGDAARLTRSGASLGTPGFWPPEQATGKRERVGPASDVYGLGATLYALLSGRAPFERATIRELLVATCEERPASLQPQVDPTLDAIVLRCLEKAPQDRYPDAGALAQALEAYLVGAAVTASRGPGLRLVAAALVVLALIPLGLAASRTPSTAPLDTPSASAAAAPAVVPVSLSEALARARAEGSRRAWAAAERGVEDLPGRLGPAARAALLEGGGARLVVLRLYREGRFEEALRVAEAHAAGDPWADRAWTALRTVEGAREALAAVLRLLADMSRPEAPRPAVDGLLPSWRTLDGALRARRDLSPALGRLRDLIRDELRATAVAAVYLLGGPARDHDGERKAFEAFAGRLSALRGDEPRSYDRLGALEERLRSDTWSPSPGDPPVATAAAELAKIPGPGAELLRIGCLCVLAREAEGALERRVSAARAAAALCSSDPDRPLGLSVRLGRAWRLLTQPVLDRVWEAVRLRKPPPYDLTQLERELAALSVSGPRAAVLLCLGRVEDAAALRRFKGSMLDIAIRAEVHLVRGEPERALRVLAGQKAAAFDAVRAHARALLRKPPGPVRPGRGLSQWFPWHTPAALPKVLAGEWWWPGAGPLSGG